MSEALNNACQKLVHWFRDQTLPIWYRNGLDQSSGSVYDRLFADGSADTSANRHLRSQAQFALVLAMASQRNWIGDVTQVVSGLHRFSAKYGTLPDRSDGYVRTLSADFDIIDTSHDLIDHALFAWSSSMAYQVFSDPSDLRRAINILEWVKVSLSDEVLRWKVGAEDDPQLLARPILVLFNVLLYMYHATQKPRWQVMANEIYNVFLSRYFDSNRRVIRVSGGEDGFWLDTGSMANWACAIAQFEYLLKIKTSTAVDLVISAVNQVEVMDGVLVPDLTNSAQSPSRTHKYQLEHLCDLICVSLMLCEGEVAGTKARLKSIAVAGINALFDNFAVLGHPGLSVNTINQSGRPVSHTSQLNSLYATCLAAVSANKFLTGQGQSIELN